MSNQPQPKASTKSSKRKNKHRKPNHLKSVNVPEFTIQTVTLRGPDFESISKTIKEYESDEWYSVGNTLCFEALGYCKHTMQKKVYKEDANKRFYKFQEVDY